MSAAGVHRSGGAKKNWGDWGTDVVAVGGWSVGSNSKNHSSHHISLQNSFCESHT